MTAQDFHKRDHGRGGMYALAGPSAKADPLTLPVRGDLAHVRLAGQVFVPHYAVPMPHLVAAAGAQLCKAPRGGEVLAELAAGAGFDVLDIAGSWAWGETAGGGAVGYVAIDQLETGG